MNCLLQILRDRKTEHNSKIYVNCRFSLGYCNQLRRFNLSAFRQESSPQSATAYICGPLWVIPPIPKTLIT